jgi:hypothetical protein
VISCFQAFAFTTSACSYYAAGLQSRIQGILRRLDDAEGGSRESVGLLMSVDAVKGRMEGARDTLQEAAGLAELMASVEDVFATGNIRTMADTLASMRRGEGRGYKLMNAVDP